MKKTQPANPLTAAKKRIAQLEAVLKKMAIRRPKLPDQPAAFRLCRREAKEVLRA